MFLINESYIVTGLERKIVYELQVSKDTMLISGLYRFFGSENHLCSVNVYVSNEPVHLWINTEGEIMKLIQKGKKLKIEIVNNSADSLIVNILLKLEDLQKS